MLAIHFSALIKLSIKQLMVLSRNDSLPHLLNLGSNSALTTAELAHLVKEVEFKGEIVFDSTKPDGTMKKLMDSGRLNQLGWVFRVTLKKVYCFQ